MIATFLLVGLLQQTVLTGVVRDSIDLEPVAFARVTVAATDGEAPPTTGISDRFGAFVVSNVPAGRPVRVDVEVLGYAPWTRAYEALPAGPVRVLLRPAPVGLDALEVRAGGRAGDPISLSRDAFVVDSALMRALPTILETDVLRATAVSPSASAPSDYTSVPFIRGGTSDGTPVLLDGVRLFNAFHLGGFLSAINAEVVERATVLPSSAGDGQAIGSLSGAIDIATRDGSRERRRVAGSLGLASARLSVEGPVGESMSYLVDGRRTYIDGFTAALKELGAINQRLPYFFQDLHAKVTKDFGGVRRLSVSGYLNSESLKAFDGQETRTLGLAWGNAALSVHYRDRIGGTGIVDANLGHSRFTSDLLGLGGGSTTQVGEVVEYAPPADTLLFGTGSMSETRADLRVTWHAGPATVTAGTQATRFSGNHDYRLSDGFEADGGYFFSPLDLDESRWRLASYSSVELPLDRGFSIRAGLRVDRFQELATTLAPFGELTYSASWWSARVSGSRSHQALASVRNEEALGASFLAYDLMVPVNEAPVPRNTEFSIGWEGSRSGLRVRLDAYTRALDHLRLPDLGAEPITGAALGDPSLWTVSTGSARGVEASWSWVRDRLSLLGSYRWARVSRTVGTRVYTPRFHRDHEFELGMSWSTGASTWSARMSLRSGQPTTPVVAVVPVVKYGRGGVADLVPLGGGYNADKLPRYARIDVGWRREGKSLWFEGGTVTPYVSVANLFSLPNVVARFVDRKSSGDAGGVYLPQLPMMPFFGVEFRF